MKLFQELKRRNVFKAGIAYIVVAWVILQVADIMLDIIEAPGWVSKVLLLFLAIGFPLIIMFAWAFDMTPDGLKRTESADKTEAAEPLPEPGAKAVAEPAVPGKASVAVLPFVNMSGDKENEYFSDGLSEELLNVLAKINALKVAARTSSFHFKGQTGHIAEIGRQLGVASVLEGSVRQSGSRVRITAQLINVADGYHLWSETFDRELTDIFAVQDEIASAVAEALKVKLLGGESTSLAVGGTSNPEAFKQYLQGVHYRNRGSDKDALTRAANAFQRAVDLDPDYALAWAGLAMAWEEMASNNFVGLDNITTKVRQAASRSIELAPGLADGYQVLGRALVYYQLDFEGAQRVMDTALKLNPGNVDVQMEYSRLNTALGNLEVGIAAARKALELDPVSLTANHFFGHALYFARRYDDAIAVYRKVLKLDPHYPRPHYEIGMCLLQQGHIEAALAEVEQEPLTWMKFSGMAILLHHLDRKEEAGASMSLLIADYRDNGLYQQAQVHAQWGDTDRAIETLHKSRDIGDPGTSQLLIDPLMDPLRQDPRFEELLRSVGFNRA